MMINYCLKPNRDVAEEWSSIAQQPAVLVLDYHCDDELSEVKNDDNMDD